MVMKASTQVFLTKADLMRFRGSLNFAPDGQGQAQHHLGSGVRYWKQWEEKAPESAEPCLSHSWAAGNRGEGCSAFALWRVVTGVGVGQGALPGLRCQSGTHRGCWADAWAWVSGVGPPAGGLAGSPGSGTRALPGGPTAWHQVPPGLQGTKGKWLQG